MMAGPWKALISLDSARGDNVADILEAEGVDVDADEAADGLLVEALGMDLEDGGGVDRHGRVDEYGQLGHLALQLQGMDDVDQLLGALDGEGGDDDLAAPRLGLVDELGQLPRGHADRLVQAVAVGRFQHQVIHGRHDLGVADDRQARAAQVAAEADAQAARQGEMHHGRAQDVAGVEKLGRHAVQGTKGAVVVAGDEMAQGLDGLLGAVERFIGGQLPFGVLGRLFHDDLVILLLDVGAVQQDDLGDVAAWRRWHGYCR